MSIVVTTKDHYAPARSATLAEEKEIDVSGGIQKWKKRELVSQKVLSVILAVVIGPLVLAWSLLIGGVVFSFSLSLAVLKFLGGIFKQSVAKIRQ